MKQFNEFLLRNPDIRELIFSLDVGTKNDPFKLFEEIVSRMKNDAISDKGQRQAVNRAYGEVIARRPPDVDPLSANSLRQQEVWESIRPPESDRLVHLELGGRAGLAPGGERFRSYSATGERRRAAGENPALDLLATRDDR
jgi:hypothetical protein